MRSVLRAFARQAGSRLARRGTAPRKKALNGASVPPFAFGGDSGALSDSLRPKQERLRTSEEVGVDDEGCKRSARKGG